MRDDIVHPIDCGKGTLDGDEFAIDAVNDGRANFQMDIGSAPFHGRFQNLNKQFHAEKINKAVLSAKQENGKSGKSTSRIVNNPARARYL
jgi:hypothetical protein